MLFAVREVESDLSFEGKEEKKNALTVAEDQSKDHGCRSPIEDQKPASEVGDKG